MRVNSKLLRDCATRLLGLATIAGFTAAAFSQTAQSPPAHDDADSDVAKPQFVRVVEDKGQSIALEIASQEFKPADGKGPTVCLVGVAHIGDRSFYRAIERVLAGYDIVLYESVKPAGTAGAGGETDEERIESTKSAMQYVGGLIESFKSRNDEFPQDIAALREFTANREPRLAAWLDVAMKDAWGATLVYERAPSGDSYSLKSLGADGALGGEESAADIDLPEDELPDALTLSSEDGLQSQLADALDLEFQLEAIDYSHDNWRCSDMAIDQVSRAMSERGLDFGPMGGTLAGSSFPARIIKMLLGLMRMADTLMDGAIADTFKIVMIEMLGDEQFIEQGLGQLGKGFTEVIVEQRNQVAVDDLAKIISDEPSVKSVAIFYGAAHMPDLGKRLVEQLNYAPSETQWVRAIEVDLASSAVSARDINQIRRMLKQMMKAQMR